MACVDSELVYLSPVKDANTMELEGEFMRRRQEVTMEMLKRLDYHVQEEAIRRRINHRHMLDWIEAQVSKSLEGKQVRGREGPWVGWVESSGSNREGHCCRSCQKMCPKHLPC